MKAFLIQGVPASVQSDGWWVSAPPRQGQGDFQRDAQAPHPLAPLVMLVALILCGDALLWQVVPAASLAVFGAVVVLAAWAVQGRRLRAVQALQVATLTVLGVLPLLENVSLLSLAWLALGVSLAIVALGDVSWRHLPTGLLRWMQWAPVQPFVDMTRAKQAHDALGRHVSIKSLALGWALPLGLGLVFTALLVDANPMLSGWIDQVQTPHVDVVRVIFWSGLALILWPCLRVMRMRARLNNPLSAPRSRALPSLFNQASVTRSLVLFNAIFALQTGLDVTYLYSGFALPDGMTYAEYAHRGAYPLVATALLAGLFALIARRFAQDAPLVRWLLLAWVVQNVLLVISSIYRLELYVEVYGLTRLRIAAFIWMGLVAAGLMLTLWQVWHMRPAQWLLSRAAVLGMAVLYGASFVDVDRMIAQYNTTQAVPFDPYYMCNLSASATPVLLAAGECRRHGLAYYPVPLDWREWGFRSARVRHTLTTMKQEGM